MQSTHFKFCVFLAILTVPVFILDKLFMGRSSGGWISLDFSGLLIGAWVIFLIVHIIVSSLAVSRFPQSSLVVTHLLSGVLSIALIIVGGRVVMGISDASENKRYQEEKEKRKLRMGVIELKEWWYVPDDKNPKEVYVNVTVTEAGRFAGNINGLGKDTTGFEFYVISSTDAAEQRHVEAGENFTHVFPMGELKDGNILLGAEITLYLFKEENGPSSLDVTKIYTNKFERDDDGQYFYAPLPAPIRK